MNGSRTASANVTDVSVKSCLMSCVFNVVGSVSGLTWELFVDGVDNLSAKRGRVDVRDEVERRRLMPNGIDAAYRPDVRGLRWAR